MNPYIIAQVDTYTYPISCASSMPYGGLLKDYLPII